MQGKMAVSLILFLFPSLTVPVLAVFFLRGIPGAAGAFVSDNSASIIWVCYLLLLAGWIAFYFWLRASTRKAQVNAQAAESAHAEPQALTEEVLQE